MIQKRCNLKSTVDQMHYGL